MSSDCLAWQSSFSDVCKKNFVELMGRVRIPLIKGSTSIIWRWYSLLLLVISVFKRVGSCFGQIMELKFTFTWIFPCTKIFFSFYLSSFLFLLFLFFLSFLLFLFFSIPSLIFLSFPSYSFSLPCCHYLYRQKGRCWTKRSLLTFDNYYKPFMAFLFTTWAFNKCLCILLFWILLCIRSKYLHFSSLILYSYVMRSSILMYMILKYLELLI